MRHSIRSNTPANTHDSSRPPGEMRNIDDRRLLDGSRRERAMLVVVLLPGTRADLRDPLGELAALAESAGVEVVGQLVQKRTELTAATALGKGKLAEVNELVLENQADVVIFDNDLAPRQIRGLEKALSRKIIDRSELILDIFAARARTREAQLQVELAQLEYTAPRLRGMWTHLERIAGAGGGTSAGAVGGVGTRGPGERQIEIDRRIVRDRISHLKRELREIGRRKQREVKARGDHYTVSLVGYTNSGKSTLMNRLTAADRYAADQLFATLDTKTVRWQLGEGHSVLLSDTVGFIRDIPHHLVASFRATLEETIHADLLLHMVDVSSPQAWQQMDAVNEVLKSLGSEHIPQIVLLNKVDVADHGVMAELLARRGSTTLPISALTGEGLEALRQEILNRTLAHTVTVTVQLPHAAGKALVELSRVADVLARRYTDDAVELDLRILRSQLEQLHGRFPAMTIVQDAAAQVADDDSPGEPRP